MKKQLFLYLFILALMVNCFTYMYYSKGFAFLEKRYEKLNLKMTSKNDSLVNLLVDANHFAIENNDNAQNYFDGKDVSIITKNVTNGLLAFNDDPNGNKFTGQVTMGSQKFIINKIKILNHRWIIADFSDGQLWGEVLVKYFLNADDSISYEIIETQLFPKETN